MKSENDRSTTLPFVDDDRLMTVSEFARVAGHMATASSPLTSGVRLTTLSPSLLADLERFENEGEGAEPLEVLAASVRHARPLVVFLGLGDRVLPLRLFPVQGMFSCPTDILSMPRAHVERLRVLRVDPGIAYRGEASTHDGAVAETGPLPRLLWHVAMFGHRSTLLPEIAGPVSYRVSRALAIENLPTDDTAARLLRRMRRHALTLREIEVQPGIGRERAARLLNALYLQAGLIALRTAPDSASSLWHSLLRRRPGPS